MSLHIQEYLRNGGTLEELSTTLGITAKRHNKYNNLVLFKYNQIESPMGNPIVQECRGIILDESDNWKVIARAFDKFFNYGEGHAAVIDWKTARVQEKLDGSLCLVYHYDGMWHVATTGTPDASGKVGSSEQTFADYFWQTLGCKPEEFGCTKSDMCFTWELMGPDNRIVVVHHKPRLVLLSGRIRTTGQEILPETARMYIQIDNHNLLNKIEVVKEYPLQSIEDICATFDTMSPLQQEGYIIVWTNPDGSFGRNKSKHPGYVALHHAKDGMNTKTFVQIVRTGEASEAVTAFPEFKPMLEDVKQRYDILLAAIEAEYAMHRSIPVQKDFALAVKNSRCSGALFQLRAGKVKSIREFLAKCHIDTIMNLLGY